MLVILIFEPHWLVYLVLGSILGGYLFFKSDFSKPITGKCVLYFSVRYNQNNTIESIRYHVCNIDLDDISIVHTDEGKAYKNKSNTGISVREVTISGKNDQTLLLFRDWVIPVILQVYKFELKAINSLSDYMGNSLDKNYDLRFSLDQNGLYRVEWSLRQFSFDDIQHNLPYVHLSAEKQPLKKTCEILLIHSNSRFRLNRIYNLLENIRLRGNRWHRNYLSLYQEDTDMDLGQEYVNYFADYKTKLDSDTGHESTNLQQEER